MTVIASVGRRHGAADRTIGGGRDSHILERCFTIRKSDQMEKGRNRTALAFHARHREGLKSLDHVVIS